MSSLRQGSAMQANQILSIKSKKPIIEIKNLNFSFGNNLVLKDISLDILEGDFVALIGQNGSGKTTIVKLILGLHSFNEGEISLFGKSIKIFKDWGKIGYVPQKVTNFDPNFPATVKEIVAMGLLSNKTFPKMITKGDRLLVLKSLQKVGMENFRNKRIGELSGGQQQRVFIARAIVSNPKVLFLDEPTTGIDQDTQTKFYDLLGALNKEGITIVLVSHDISHITNYVTKIASLNQTLQFFGSHKDFCSFDKEHHHEREEHNICMHR